MSSEASVVTFLKSENKKLKKDILKLQHYVQHEKKQRKKQYASLVTQNKDLQLALESTKSSLRLANEALSQHDGDEKSLVVENKTLQAEVEKLVKFSQRLKLANNKWTTWAKSSTEKHNEHVSKYKEELKRRKNQIRQLQHKQKNMRASMETQQKMILELVKEQKVYQENENKLKKETQGREEQWHNRERQLNEALSTYVELNKSLQANCHMAEKQGAVLSKQLVDEEGKKDQLANKMQELQSELQVLRATSPFASPFPSPTKKNDKEGRTTGFSTSGSQLASELGTYYDRSTIDYRLSTIEIECMECMIVYSPCLI